MDNHDEETVFTTPMTPNAPEAQSEQTVSTYAALVNLDEGTSLKFVQAPLVNGRKCAKIDPQDVAPEIHFWQSAILCAVLGANPPLQKLIKFLLSINKQLRALNKCKYADLKSQQEQARLVLTQIQHGRTTREFSTAPTGEEKRSTNQNRMKMREQDTNQRWKWLTGVQNVKTNTTSGLSSKQGVGNSAPAKFRSPDKSPATD
ncbi:hypothetical protein Cgig2_001819 [Carnegiea gigantea]|uniref:Uncharacterized protein n=1 Tax=Carnegiea gigantea TaxID=171969 RepID=A0A9Q1GSV7_9CARY|nr:hypothetical protein Cgig2_001819 [Carnegiea gigantea]